MCLLLTSPLASRSWPTGNCPFKILSDVLLARQAADLGKRWCLPVPRSDFHSSLRQQGRSTLWCWDRLVPMLSLLISGGALQARD
jgi:hypothetical protein